MMTHDTTRKQFDRGELIASLFYALEKAQQYVRMLRSLSLVDRPVITTTLEVRLQLLSEDMAQIAIRVNEVQHKLEALRDALSDDIG